MSLSLCCFCAPCRLVSRWGHAYEIVGQVRRHQTTAKVQALGRYMMKREQYENATGEHKAHKEGVMEFLHFPARILIRFNSGLSELLDRKIFVLLNPQR